MNNTISACQYLINYCLNYCDNIRVCYCDCVNNDDQYNSLCVYKNGINMNILILCISLTIFICIFCTWCKVKFYNSYVNNGLTRNFDNYSNNILHPTLLTQDTRTYLQYPDYQSYVYEYDHNEDNNNEDNQNDALPKYTEINLNNDTPPPPSYLYVNVNHHTTQNNQTTIHEI